MHDGFYRTFSNVRLPIQSAGDQSEAKHHNDMLSMTADQADVVGC
jgi:hypothetical protein